MFIFFSRRSGSTWLTELVAAEPGMRFVQDPLLTRNVLPRYAPLLGRERYPYFLRAAPEHEALMLEYFQRLLAGEIHTGTPWRIFARDFQRATNRNVLKVANASGLMDWFEAHFHCRTVYLLRHPIPTVLSQAEYAMEPRTASFLGDAWFAEQVLTSAQRARAEAVLRSGDPLAQRVVDWCCENLIPLTRSDRVRGGSCSTYEELSANPRSRAARAEVAHCELRALEKLSARFRVPSATASAAARSGVKPAHWLRWRSALPPERIQELMALCAEFEIDVYAADSAAPRRFVLDPASFAGLPGIQV